MRSLGTRTRIRLDHFRTLLPRILHRARISAEAIPGGRYDYGLPPPFCESIVKKFLELRKERELAHTSRDDEKQHSG
jgi:hypothetical protein